LFDLQYLALLLKGTNLKEDENATAQPVISGRKIYPIVIGFPPLAEQHRIVAKVDELMAFCDQLEQTQSDNIAAHSQLVEALLATLTNSSDHNELQNNWQRIATHFDSLFTTEHSIDQLKQTILQLAVMGNLVPQNPNDEPASELLKKIAAEKAQLIKEGKIKKEKPLPEIADEEKPFALPRGWVETRFQDITKVITCGMASTPKYHPSGRIFLSAKNVKPYRFIPDDHNFVDEETFRKITQNAFPEKGDILLTRVGAGIGEAAIIDIDIEFAFYVSLTLIKPFLNHLNSKYLLHWLSSPQGITKSLENVYGAGVSQGNLNVNQVRMFDVPIPPLDEQHRIVTKVDELMTLCDTLKTNLQNAQTTQLALADALVEQALR
jgi:type I restriction enzyme S subunit